MIFDVDDLHEGHDRLDLLQRLKDANPAFKVTAFAVPALCSEKYLDSLPDWIELAAHGWNHGGHGCPDPLEAKDWSYEQAMAVLECIPERFVEGWKSPGWQISDGTYQALLERGWWVADQPYNDHRRPPGLHVHRLGDGDHLHTHVQNVCGNGLEELFPQLYDRVVRARTFEWVSEVVQ